MNRLYPVSAAVLCLALCQQIASAQAPANISITITPSVGPNPYDSPSNTGYQNAALYALSGGTVPGSAEGSGPTAFNPVLNNTFGTNQIVNTVVPSWLGVVNPSSPYAGEYGNQIYFGGSIVSTNWNQGTQTGTLFSAANVGYAVNSTTDPADLAFNSTQPGYGTPTSFSSTFIGVDQNGNFLTSGSTAGVLLQALYWVGPSIAYSSNSTNQSGLNGDINSITALNGGPVNLSGTYSLSGTTSLVGGTVTGTNPGGSVSTPSQSGVVPEPVSVAVLGIGLIGLGGYVYRRRPIVPIAV